MLVSINFLKNSLEKYNEVKEKEKKENFSLDFKSINKGLNLSFYTFILFLAVIFMFFELFLLYFAVYIAIYCSKSKEEKIVNFVLAVTFTIPYVMLNILFNDDAKKLLKNGMKIKET
jgi:preprotein translocase subunit SecY